MSLLELEAGQGHVVVTIEWSHPFVSNGPRESRVLLALFELGKREGHLAAVLVLAGLL